MIEAALAAIEASPVAAALEASRYLYPAVNGLHILGLATLFGAILAFDLKLLGLFPSLPTQPFALTLPRVAGCGLALAAVTGILLFSVEPIDYAYNPAFQAKLLLIAAGILHVAAVHASADWRRLTQGTAGVTWRLRLAGALSLVTWSAAIMAGRLIAFIG